MKAPIVVIVFNRPEETARLRERLKFEECRELFLISDGPRRDCSGEAEKVDACRKIFKDWQGKTHVNFSESNMGCKARITSGLDWAFGQTDRAIILEDDCMPHSHFYQYCDDMLEMYAHNTNVMSICGTKVVPFNYPNSDIFFSKYGSSWGWGTWRRAWMEYDDEFNDISSFEIIRLFREQLGSYRASLYWFYLLRKILRGSLNSWAYCWMISCFLRGGIHVYPNSNLVINIGYGRNATHTIDRMSYMPIEYGKVPAFPIRTPDLIETWPIADRWFEDNVHSKSIDVRGRWFKNILRRHFNFN